MAGLPKRIVQSLQILHQRVQLPAEFADIVDPQRPHRAAGQLDFLAAQPTEGVAVQRGVRQLAENLPGAGAGQHQNAALIGDIGDAHLLAGPDALPEMVQVAQLCAGRRQDVVQAAGKMGDGQFAADAPAFRQDVRQNDAALLRHPIGAKPVQEGCGIGPAHFIFGEAGEVEEADPLAHRQALLGHQGEDVAAAKAVHLLAPVRGEPLRPFPAKGLRVAAALRLQLGVQGA